MGDKFIARNLSWLRPLWEAGPLALEWRICPLSASPVLSKDPLSARASEDGEDSPLVSPYRRVSP